MRVDRGDDQPYAGRLLARDGEIRVANAVEECAVFLLEAVELAAVLGERLARYLVGAIEDQRAMRAHAGMSSLAETPDQVRAHAFARALVGRSRVGESIEDDVMAGLYRRLDDLRDVVGARGEDEERLHQRRHRLAEDGLAQPLG